MHRHHQPDDSKPCRFCSFKKKREEFGLQIINHPIKIWAAAAAWCPLASAKEKKEKEKKETVNVKQLTLMLLLLLY